MADPQLLGGKLAIRGTRLSVSLILECLAGGTSLEDIDDAFDRAFPHEALPEVLKVAPSSLIPSMWLLDANMGVHLAALAVGIRNPLRYGTAERYLAGGLLLLSHNTQLRRNPSVRAQASFAAAAS